VEWLGTRSRLRLANSCGNSGGPADQMHAGRQSALGERVEILRWKLMRTSAVAEG